jgi:hypothetical protein
MPADESTLGCSALLRVAGLPIRYWLAGANPKLFEKVARLERDEKLRHVGALHLAERIGKELVPSPALSRDDRAHLLAVRRRLHRGGPIAKADCERLHNMAGLSHVDSDLVQTLGTMVDRDQAMAVLWAALEKEVALEQYRLLLLSQEIYRESQVAKALLAPPDPEDSRPGSQLSRKSRRQRCEHEWRRIARAATGTTPRGWLSHLALLPIEGVDLLLAPALTEHFTVQWMENVRARSLALTNPPDDWPLPESRLAMNPLRWDADGCLVCIVLDEKREHAQVAVRHTGLLDAICTALADSVHTFAELAQALGCGTQEEWVAFRGFVRHLMVLGVLQSSAPPQVHLEMGGIPGRNPAHPVGVEGNEHGWVDVYRYAETGVSVSLVREVQRGVSQVLRILSLLRCDTTDTHRSGVATSDRTWSLTELLTAESGADGNAMSNRSETVDGSHLRASPTSGFAKLLNIIAERAGHTREVVIDSSLLDECDAPDSALTWPVDCLVRVPVKGAGFTAVLDELWPPGMLDARFLDTLMDMHGTVPRMEAYRAFLRQLEQLTGVLFVELLLPPLQDGAANAVRRPVYTSAWTGDPHTAAYVRGDTSAARYIPLKAIRIRRSDGRLRADVDGQPIWPVYHATRSFSPPWDRLARALLATAPLDLPWDFKRVIHAFTRLRGQPRVSVSGGLVLSPARWSVSRHDLWDREAPVLAKLRTLIGLRDQYSLPRWVYLDRGEKKPPSPCDLESIHAIRTIERGTIGNGPMSVMEMLPAADQFIVGDRAHNSGDRLAAQIQLRFPCDESVTATATRVARAVCEALNATRAGADGPTELLGGGRPPALVSTVWARHQQQGEDRP